MKKISLIIAVFCMMAASQPSAAQLGGALRSLGNKAAGAAQNAARKGVQDAVQNAKDAKEAKEAEAARNAVVNGRTLYVSVSTGSARSDGLTPEKPLKDLQKAIDLAEENDCILVAEGNYLGNMDRGYVESGKFGNAQNDRGKFISIYGGWSTDFSERDVLKHITKIQPTSQQFTAPLMNINARRPYGYTGPVGTVVIDG